MLQSLYLSVGRTWRAVTAEGVVTADVDDAAHTARFGQLKQPAVPPRRWELPWPRYRSTLWRALLGTGYTHASNDAMAQLLVPLLHEHRDPEQPRWWALRHPFAVTTVVEIPLPSPQPWPDDDDAVEKWLDEHLRRPLAGHPGHRLSDGVPMEAVPELPIEDADGTPITWVEVDRFRLLSGLHQELADPGAAAGRLATAFAPVPPPAALPMKEQGTFLAVDGVNVGLVRPRAGLRAGRRLACLHHNQSLVLAYTNDLLAGLAAPHTATARVYRERSARLLNHLHRHVPVPPFAGTYRSRLVRAWLGRPGVAATINQVNAEDLSAALPPLP